MRPAQKSCRVLVLSPTRELSGQIADSFRVYGRHIRPLAIELAIGGVPINRQVRVSRVAQRCWWQRLAACSTWSISARCALTRLKATTRER